MKVLIAISPFLSDLSGFPEVEFVKNPWGRNPTEAELEKELAEGDYDGLIVGTRTVRNSVASSCKLLKVISRVGVGYNNIDVEHFKNHGIVTTFTPFGPTDSTAEMALALIFAGTRRLRNYDSQVRAGSWDRMFGVRLMDATVGIVGFGRIGKKLASLLKGFGCRVLVNDTAPDYATANALGVEVTDKTRILSCCDVISFHVPLKEDTVDWLSYRELNELNRPVTIVNTARGGVVNEDAIGAFLKEHPESYYCCDVFVEEPYAGPLARIENCLLTPHAATFTTGSRFQTEQMALLNCMKILQGEVCEDVAEFNLR